MKFFKPLFLLVTSLVLTFFLVLSCKKTDSDSSYEENDACRYAGGASLQSISSTVPGVVFLYSSEVAKIGGRIEFFADQNLHQTEIKVVPVSQRAEVAWVTDHLNDPNDFSALTITSCDKKSVNKYGLVRKGSPKTLAGLAFLKLKGNQTFFLKDFEITDWVSAQTGEKNGSFIADQFPEIADDFLYEHIAGANNRDKVTLTLDPDKKEVKIIVTSIDNQFIHHTYHLKFISTKIDMEDVKKTLACGGQFATGGNGTSENPLLYPSIYCDFSLIGAQQNLRITKTYINVDRSSYVDVFLEDAAPYKKVSERVYVKQTND